MSEFLAGAPSASYLLLDCCGCAVIVGAGELRLAGR
jgi:hypothetical protein